MREGYAALASITSVGTRIFRWRRLRSQLPGHPYQVKSRADTELGVDIGQVRLDRSLADEQPVADLASRSTLDRQPGDLALAHGQGARAETGGDDPLARMTQLLQGLDRALPATFGPARAKD